MAEFNDQERRSGYCPVHNIKCDEIKTLQTDTKKRVPIWVFTLFVTATFIVLGWFNIEVAKENKRSVELLEKHFVESGLLFSRTSNILSKVTHALNEVAFNQRIVMDKIELEFQSIPEYDELEIE